MRTIGFWSFRLGPWNDLGINNRVVPVEVDIFLQSNSGTNCYGMN